MILKLAKTDSIAIATYLVDAQIAQGDLSLNLRLPAPSVSLLIVSFPAPPTQNGRKGLVKGSHSPECNAITGVLAFNKK